MARRSLKQRLIAELEQRLDYLEHDADDGLTVAARSLMAASARSSLRELRNRGSGPMPYWARQLATELGLDVPQRRAATSST